VPDQLSVGTLIRYKCLVLVPFCNAAIVKQSSAGACQIALLLFFMQMPIARR
jgi:hypothetical protein